MGVDAVSKVLYTGMEVFVEVFWGGVVSYQNDDIHLVHNFLGAKSLKILANGSI